MSRTSYNFGKRSKISAPFDGIWTLNLKCEEETGTIAFDSSGNQYNGNHNDISLITAPGKINNGFNFIGGRNNVSIPHSVDFCLRKEDKYIPMTVLVWVNFNSIPSPTSPVYMVNKWNVSSTRDWTFDYYGEQIRYRIWGDNDGGGRTIFEFNSGIWKPNVDVWYLLAVTVDIENRKIKHYVNGLLLKEVDISSSYNFIYQSTANIGIGGRAWNTAADFPGGLDEIRIKMGKILTSQEILNIYNLEK
jgi:hypothetical protein